MEATTAAEAAEGKAVVRVLAAVLERLVVANAPLACADAGPVTKFHALKAPSIGVLQYLERIHKYAACSTECFILALIYIDRLIQRNNFLLTELNVHRVVISAILLAAKFFDDAYYNNAYYAKVGGVLVSEMNGLEVEFLFRINFSLFVTPEVYYKYHAELVSHALGAQQAVPMPPPPQHALVAAAQPQHALMAAAQPQHALMAPQPQHALMAAAQPQHALVAPAHHTVVPSLAQQPTVPLTESVTDYQHGMTNFPMPVSVVPTATATDTHHHHEQFQHALAINAPQITPSPPPPAFSVIVPNVGNPAAPPPAPEEYPPCPMPMGHATEGMNQAFDNILSAQVIPSLNAQLLVLQGHQAAAAASTPMGTNQNFGLGRRLSLQLPAASSATLSPSSMSCAEQLLVVDPLLANANVYFSPRDLVIAHQAVDASGYGLRGL